MCLSMLSSINHIEEGYKVYKGIDNDYLIPELFGQNIKIGKWYDAVPLWRKLLHKKKIVYDINSNDIYPLKYEAGFHVFHDLLDTKKYADSINDSMIAKVIIKEPICTGYYLGMLVTVAKKMKVIEIIDKMKVIEIIDKMKVIDVINETTTVRSVGYDLNRTRHISICDRHNRKRRIRHCVYNFI